MKGAALKYKGRPIGSVTVKGISRGYAGALGAAAGLTFAVVALAWRLHMAGQEDALLALADGRAVVLSADAQTAVVAKGAISPQDGLTTEPPADIAPSSLVPQPGQSLASAPAAELTEQSDFGPLPRIGKDGTKPWRYYARPFTRRGSSPMVAVLVTGVGMSKQVSDQALRLPPDITFSISPYAQQAALWAGSARAVGHEVLVDLPMEPAGFPGDDPGPQALLSMYTPEQNDAHLRWVLGRVPGAAGVATWPRERFSAAKEAAEPVYRQLTSRGLMMAVGDGGPGEAQDKLLASVSLPHIKADVRIDEELSMESMQRQLLALENLAVRRGYAMGVITAYPVTLKLLENWQQALERKGIILVPVSALARMKFS